MSQVKEVREIFNSDAAKYGGSDQVNRTVALAKSNGFMVTVAPLATMVFEVDFV
jgi:hypothetical protein